MRPLTEEETKIFFEKLAKYIGKNIKFLIDRKDEAYCFRLHNRRVYYISERLMKKANHIDHKSLISPGVCFGKFSKTLKFRLHVTCLDYISPYAKYKLWVKPAAELSFLYGNHVVKAGLGRLTENTPQHEGVIVYSMADIPLGFGVMARSTTECKNLGPQDIVCFHQADLGEYLRDESNLL